MLAPVAGPQRVCLSQVHAQEATDVVPHLLFNLIKKADRRIIERVVEVKDPSVHM